MNEGTVNRRYRYAPGGIDWSAGRLFRVKPPDEADDVQGEPPFDAPPPEAPRQAPPAQSRSKEDIFDIGTILHLRTFLYLIAITGLLLFQIHNTLIIKDLARQNEQLREQLRISTSIRTSQELKAREMQSIHNISGYAIQLGLISSAEPPVDLEP